jgi:hypothetical protein|eukprot:COSAG01_NODE_85_length_27670_cov_34.051467_18_plen_50_part_00
MHIIIVQSRTAQWVHNKRPMFSTAIGISQDVRRLTEAGALARAAASLVV